MKNINYTCPKCHNNIYHGGDIEIKEHNKEYKTKSYYYCKKCRWRGLFLK